MVVLTFCNAISMKAQVMKSTDLEKYAKYKYGEKWVDAAATISKTVNSYSVSITPIIRVDIKDGRVRVTYTVQNYDVLSDISGGWITMGIMSDDRTFGDSKRKKDDKTNANLYDERWEIAKHYPFVEKDNKKRTCAKALVMTHAYSNAVIDKIEEVVKNGLVGNEDEDW